MDARCICTEGVNREVRNGGERPCDFGDERGCIFKGSTDACCIYTEGLDREVRDGGERPGGFREGANREVRDGGEWPGDFRDEGGHFFMGSKDVRCVCTEARVDREVRDGGEWPGDLGDEGGHFLEEEAMMEGEEKLA
ncbi:hypothetical protein BDQ12DRAFT_684959 [Crucibulum laeve]|uniref:Uncharacterized protein n=1 Tax=Crucibulum laeve TaxID=68775 RepID=A0A5C3M8Y2_9AGAR|nr:hypothetical protein BDQ12DRAFT_684959 [Crucibulum laeve]